MFRRGISGATLGHAIPGRLAVAGRCAAGVRSSLLEDALAASTSFAGLRQRRAARRRTTYPESTSLGIWPKRSAGILWDSQGLVQVRVVEDVPEPTYYLMIRQRLICHHKLACRCCSARQIVRRAIGRVLVLAQPSQRQADCAWAVGFAAANSLPYRWQLRLRDQSSCRKTHAERCPIV